MPPKTILKKTHTVVPVIDEDTNVDETTIVLEHDSGNIMDKKQLIKQNASISTSKSSKIIKKKVSISDKPIDITKNLETEIEKYVENEMVKDNINMEDNEVLVDVGTALKVNKKPHKKQDITEIFNDDDVDYRYIITNYDFSKNRTLPKITKYEKALLVGKRAKQIEEGANPNVKVLSGQTSIDIAEAELLLRKIPFIIKRPIGNKFEYWKPIDMEVVMD